MTKIYVVLKKDGIIKVQEFENATDAMAYIREWQKHGWICEIAFGE